MTPGFAKQRRELPWLPYSESDRVIINAHNFTSPAWTPASLTLAVWIDPGDATTVTSSGGLITAVTDKSGNSRNGSASGALRPTYVSSGLNSLNTIEFPTGTSLTLSSDANAAGAISYAIVLKRPAVGNITPLISSGSSYAYLQYGDTWHFGAESVTVAPGAGWNIAIGTTAKNSTLANRFLNGGTAVTSSGASTDTGAISLNSGYSNTAWECAGVLFAREKWTDSIREKIEGYYAHRFALTANLPSGHPYKSVAP